MALLISMGTLHRQHKALNLVVRIPGGWKARVPEVTAEPWAVGAYARYFAYFGVGGEKALQAARAAIQQSYTHGYGDGLRECISRRALEYCELWPEHRVPTGKVTKAGLPIVTLRGFDPAAIQSIYVPFQNFGNAGAHHCKEFLMEMGRAAKEER